VTSVLSLQRNIGESEIVEEDWKTGRPDEKWCIWNNVPKVMIGIYFT
jgi:hypothetical protein